MAKDKVNQTKSVDLPPAGAQPQVAAPGQVQVNQGNVPIVTVQLLNDINQKLGKVLAALEKQWQTFTAHKM